MSASALSVFCLLFSICDLSNSFSFDTFQTHRILFQNKVKERHNNALFPLETTHNSRLINPFNALHTSQNAQIEDSGEPRLSLLKEVRLNLHRQRQMHGLAAAYFGSRHFLFLYLPSITITMVSGILSFFAKISMNYQSPATPTTISIVAKVITKIQVANIVGILSVISVFLQSINKELDWSHRSKMHEYLAVDLRALNEKLDVDIMQYENGNEIKGNVDDLVDKYQSQFDQAMKSCKSSLPIPIMNAFELIMSRLRFEVFPPVRSLRKGDSSERDNEIEVEWTSFMMYTNNEIYNQFSTSLFWPYIMPSGEKAIRRVMKKTTKIKNP